MNNTTDYQAHAVEFLMSRGIEFSATRTINKICPPWDDSKHIHGDAYVIELTRNGKSIRFNFWNSAKDALNNIKPTRYDVLANVSSGVLDNTMTFEQFCDTYDYNSDSMKAHKTYKACAALAVKLQKIFITDEEIEELQEIQ